MAGLAADQRLEVFGGDGSRTIFLNPDSVRDRAPNLWDRQGRPSWVRLDRVLEVPETGIRREGAVLDRARFDAVAARLRSGYGWV